MYANCKNKLANDINPYSIAFLQKIQKDGCGWLPKNNKEFTENKYNYVKAHKEEFDNAFLGFIGFSVSFGGKWFGGWSRGFNSKNCERDYVNEAYKNAMYQAEMIKDVTFICSSYEQVKIPENAVIYCDIPYKETTKYKTDSFDYEKFYNWCKVKSKEGHKIFISEYSMPDDFICVWEKEINVTVAKDCNNKKAREKLFTL